MKRKIITTADGSKTIHIEDWNEQYHSIHGAIAEAKHVFIESALHHFVGKYQGLKEISILEIGFGTGLNALLTSIAARNLQININYTGVEAYPIGQEEIKALNYEKQLSIEEGLLNRLHNSTWEEDKPISEFFNLKKKNQKFEDLSYTDKFEIIYFDAFGPRVQPDLWDERVFSSMYKALRQGGVLTTYSAKGSARRAMIKCGFDVEKIAGPPGKREMLRASKGK